MNIKPIILVVQNCMNKNKLTALIIAALVIMVSCHKEDVKPDNSRFIDHGFIPAQVSIFSNSFTFQTAIHHDNHVFVATSDGLWKNNLTTKQWSRAGFDGKTVTLIYKHPTIANKLFAGTQSNETSEDKTFHISIDGGATWQAADAPIFDNANNKYENYVCLAVRPDHPDHIYANMEGGTTIAISKDGGLSWARMNNQSDSYFGYGSVIVFLPGNANQIYQGSENPLDDAWLGKYDIDETDPISITNFEKIIDTQTWENRRPNELQTYSFVPNAIYVGQEGALSKVTGTTNKFIYKSENDNYPYSYIQAIWADPANTDHLLFGGFLNNAEQPMSLYETYDEGETIARIEDKLELDNPLVMEIISTNTYPAIILEDYDKHKVKLALYKP
jgi:hypothetical protein